MSAVKRKIQKKANLDSGSASGFKTGEPIFRCGVCLLHGTADMPSGKNPRHMDGSPLCKERNR